jgi:hypothetical protein
MTRIKFVAGSLLMAVAVVGTLRQSFSFIVGGILAVFGFIVGLGIEISRGKEPEPDQSAMSPYSEPPLRLKELIGRETEAQTPPAHPLKNERNCDCACHCGGVIIHVVPCCNAPVSILTSPRSQKPQT